MTGDRTDGMMKINNSNNELVNHDYLDNQISLSLIDFNSSSLQRASKNFHSGI